MIVLLHFVISFFLAMIQWALFGSLKSGHALASLLGAALIVGLIYLWKRQGNLEIQSPGDEPADHEQFERKTWWGRLFEDPGFQFALVLILTLPFWAFNFVHRTNGWYSFNRFNLGDIGWHVQLVRYFASGEASFWPENPMYSGARLVYPFGLNLYQSLFVSLGFSIEGVFMIIAALGLTLSTVYLARVGGWWAVSSLWLSGGVFFGYEPNWKNIVYSLMLTQQNFLFLIPIGIHLIHRQIKGSPFVLLDFILWAALPWLSLHGFVAISIILFLLWRLDARAQFFPLWGLGLVAAGAMPLIFAIGLWHSQAGNAISLSPLWDWDSSKQSYSAFIFQNWGPWLLCLSVLAYFAPDLRKKLFWLILGFVTFHFVILAPWRWDNVKLIVWFYLAVNLLIGQWLKKKALVLQGLLIVLAFFPGWNWHYNLSPWSHAEVNLLNDTSVNEALDAIAGVDSKAVWLADMSYNHPLQWLGRLRFAGYSGHIWTHGYNLDAKTKAITSFLNDPVAAKAAGVDYVFWSKRERESYGDLGDEWQGHLLKDGPVKVYGL